MSVSATHPPTTTSHRQIGPETALLFAVILFAVSVRADAPGAGLATLVATASLAASIWMVRPSRDPVSEDESRIERRLFAVTLIVAALGAIGWSPPAIGPSDPLLEVLPGVGWICLTFVVFLTRRRLDTRLVAMLVTLATLVLTLVVGVLHLNEVEGLGLDVYVLHNAAADAIANGDNPYTDAVVVSDGSPLAEPGATITGYPYPPITAISYAMGNWAFSDPRFTGLISWLVVLCLVGGSAIRRRSTRSLYVMLLLASVPGWPLILRAGWTEPLSLLFFTAAFLTWKKAGGSGFTLGLGLASKQYFAVTAPVALLHRDEGWGRRLLVAGAAVVVTVGFAMLLDFSAFWSAAVEFHTNTPPRPNSSNLVGLLDGFGVTWAPPAALGIVLGLVTGIAAGRTSRTSASFLMATALTLAVSFLVSSQAFANYWFLIFGLCSLALISRSSEENPNT